MEGIAMLPFSSYPIRCPLLFQIGLLGELLVAYFAAGGNVVVQILALAGQWYMIPLGLQASDAILDVIPVVIVVLTVDPSIMSGGTPQPQWVSYNRVFQSELRPMLCMVNKTPDLPPNKDATMRSETVGKKVEPKVPSSKEMNMDVGPTKTTARQDHEPTTVRKEKKQRQSQHGVGKEDEVVVGEVDDFPQLALLPKEWTY